jgi:DNA invertase Pin-like site-specific DNA recombinase
MTAAIYARVSIEDQNCGLQLTSCAAMPGRMGFIVVEYVEKASGKAGGKRPHLEKLLDDARLRKFDVVLVRKMNVQALDSAGVRFVAPSQNLDTDNKSPMGKFLMHIFAAFAEFERDLIVERVKACAARPDPGARTFLQARNKQEAKLLLKFLEKRARQGARPLRLWGILWGEG